MATNLVLIENDIRKMLIERVKPKGIEVKGKVLCKCVAVVDDEVFKAVKQPRVQEKLTLAAGKVYNATVDKIAKDLMVFDKIYVRTPDPDERYKIIQKLEISVKKQLADLEKKGVAAANMVWQQMQKDQAELQAFKIKMGMKIAKDAIELTGLAVSAVGTGGLALIPASLELARVTFRMGRLIAKLAKDADKTQKNITKNLAKLQKSYNANKKNALGAKETGKTILNKVFGSDYTKTISSVKADNKIYLNKLIDIDQKADTMSGALDKLLKQMQKISKTPEGKSSAKVKKQITSIETKVNNLLSKISNLNTKLDGGRDFQKNTDDALNELENMKTDKWKKIQAGAAFVTDVVLAVEDPTELSDWFEAAVGQLETLVEEEQVRMGAPVG
ncbi:hypothetical protein [Parasulfitobacter algicola]|uniref:Uncharacterized protein n=1 Tax=Parasulfitobacter algicola TaxID=2614809 RepID=A0ABX2IU25_9RHOB|nr:hypothetical protein [Sulfitobacter algicola]NSX53683.1 hypothetical protein [Sulfitobacter algicola]